MDGKNTQYLPAEAPTQGDYGWARALEQAPVCVHRVDRAGRFTAINPAGLAMLSADSVDEVRGRRFLDGVSREEQERVAKLMENAFCGECEAFEFTGADGRVYASSFVPVASGGDVVELVGISQDITRRCVAERALRTSEARNRQLVMSAPHCIHEIDLDGRLISMNPAGLEMMGLGHEEQIVGAAYLSAVCDADRPRVASLLKQALRGQASQFDFQAANGAHFSSSFVPIFDEHQNVTRLMGQTIDVTEETNSRRGVEAMRRRLEVALIGSGAMLWERSIEQDEVTWTRAVAKGHERHLETGTGLHGEAFSQVHPDDRPALERRIARCLEGHSLESEHRVLDDEGYRWVLVRGSVVERDGDGRPTHIAGTALDVTAHHQAEEHRRDLEASLQRAQRLESVGQLAGGIAHDFNNLLQVIMGHLGLALSMINSAEPIHELLEEANDASRRASRLTRRLLSFSRQEPTQQQLVSLSSFLQSFVRMARRVLPETINVETEVDDDLPCVLLDPGQLEQVILNLSVNARDAMPEGGQLLIRATMRDGDDQTVELQVEDNGTGMSSEIAARAFDPFFTTKGKQSGTGLGLAMVYGIVTQNGGEVKLRSTEGKGTVVALRFPAAAGEIQTSADDPVSPVLPASQSTVLVVEDEPMVRRLFERTLHSAGYKVITAVDGAEGLARFHEHSDDIDLVLADAVMPRMGGEQMCAKILETQPQTKFLFTSGYHEDTALSKDFLERHRLRVLSKPHSPTKLLSVIGQILATDNH